KFLSIGMAISAGLIFSKFGFAKNLKTAGESSLSFMNPLNAKAEAVIVLWMAGGPSQFETFSPKTQSKNSGSTKSIITRVPTIEIAHRLPQIADQMDKISLIRT